MSTEPQSKSARQPVRIGKYEVVKHIATGGMGAVYRARDTALDREVALKVLPKELAANPGAIERFRREARNAAKLRHENIVSIYECGEVQGTWFLALEFVEGIDLYEYINRKTHLDPEEARRITIQAALALQHAYQQGIVHRDIKPSNFLVTRKNDRLVVKLTDLGLSRESRADATRVTRDGTTVGTVDYMAPEQGRDSSRADIRSDIYSLGCTLYHMLAGKPPFSEGGLTERLCAHAFQEAPDIRRCNPLVSEALMAVLRRMLAKQAADRYQTPAELVKDLMDIDVRARPVSDRDILAELAHGETESVEVEKPEDKDDKSRRQQTAKRCSDGVARSQQESTKKSAEPQAELPAQGMPTWVIATAAGALLLLAILAGLLVLRKTGTLSLHRLESNSTVVVRESNVRGLPTANESTSSRRLPADVMWS
jgi:serine/threonine protein kinase